MKRLILLPLDERPATTALPQLVGAVAGVQVVLPPAHLLPRLRSPGEREDLGKWLVQQAPGAAGAVVALETLGLGGLLPSRLGAEGLSQVLNSWEVLRELRVPVHASAVVMRTPDADEAFEEPEYYARHGRALHALSAEMHRGSEIRTPVPAAVAADFFGRRLRNHTLNLAALSLAQQGILTTLVIGADDTARAAVGTAEQQWLGRWRDWLDLGRTVLTYPGADEVATVLTVRAILHEAALTSPRVKVHAVAGLDRVAPYENVPVGDTAAGQIAAAGGQLVGDDRADLHLVIHPPARGDGDFNLDPPATTDLNAAALTAELVLALLAADAQVAIADCAYPNGADPALMAALRDRLGTGWDRLAGFAGWNTAGNTIGTALAHALATVVGQRLGSFDPAAHARLLRHRLLEDWGWMSCARAELRATIGSDPGHHDHIDPDSAATRDAHRLLAERLAEIDPGWRIENVRFPWNRTFEIDFEVNPA
ncbi:DUF4127 family protein [Kribbella italica]|uniref:DUF4127 family protein n=1 Tax=Kribbella italica TaxID=1540520 RepID=A0A7W9J0D1_9ACTN|nr:DUF4127 family protein [Kribbella italica]MBB5833303.1 hypothetical protein [Kribbella italica]